MRRGIAIAAVLILAVSAQVHAAEIPEDIKAAAEEICAESDFDYPHIVESLAFSESKFIPDIKSANGKYYGLCQVSPKWNKDRMERLGISEEELLTVRGNITVAVDLLKELYDKHQDMTLTLLYYGGFGQKRIDRYLKDGTTPDYIIELLGRAETYKQQQEKEETNNDIGEGETNVDGAAGACVS